MTPDAIQIIRDEHRAVASMLQSLSVLAEQGPGDQCQRHVHGHPGLRRPRIYAQELCNFCQHR